MINGPLNVEWSIIGPSSGSFTIIGSRVIEWAILSSDPTPAGDIAGTLAVTWAIRSETEVLTFILNAAPTGLTGVLTITIETDEDTPTVLYGPTTQQISEQPPGSGRYEAVVPSPGVGTYFIVWSDGTNQTIEALEILTGGFAVPIIATPPARYDSTAWISAVVVEGATRHGPYVELDRITLTPDDDPSDPATRTLTTSLATLSNGWYALVWEDGNGIQSMTEPTYYTNVITET